MRVYGRSLKMNGDRGASSDLINPARKMYIHKKNRENLSDEKNHTNFSSIGALYKL